MIRRSNPFDFSELDRMFDRMSRQFEEMNRQLGSWDSGVGEMVTQRGMAIDIAEHDDSLVVVADLPGFEKEDIDLTVAGQTLTIVAEREMESESGDEGSEYLRRERRSESVRRSLRLPVEVDEENTSASYQNGALTVTLPKQQAGEEDESHHIDVN